VCCVFLERKFWIRVFLWDAPQADALSVENPASGRKLAEQVTSRWALCGIVSLVGVCLLINGVRNAG